MILILYNKGKSMKWKFEMILLFTFGILLSAAYTNISFVYAQTKPPINNDTVSTSKTTPSLSATAANKLHAVKIISPTKNQQVPIGKDLTISGTSIDNLTSSCQVSVIVNSIKPYQPATATGTGGGASDYSKWNFILTSKYTTIKQGPNNKITAKYSCINNPSVVSYSSVNVTGVTMTANTTGSNSITASAASPIKQQQQQVVTKSNNTSEGNSTTASALPTSHSTKLTYLGISKVPSSSPSSHRSGNSGGESIVQGTTNKVPSSSPSSHRSGSTKSTSQSGSNSGGSSKSEFNPFIFPFGH